MSNQNSYTVSQPPVRFAKRLKHTSLQELTTDQLRQEARDQGLDISRLNKKWEYVHVLVEQRTRGSKPHVEYVTDEKRRTVFDLPGEIRNKIYGYLLIDEETIVARYHPPGRQVTAAEEHYRRSLGLPPALNEEWTSEAVRYLTALSGASRELRKEVRSYFFYYNQFAVQGSDGASFTSFLKDIGEDGRSKIEKLDLDAEGFWRFGASFYRDPAECDKLRDFKMRIHLGHIIQDDYEKMREIQVGHTHEANDYDQLRQYIRQDDRTWVDNGDCASLSSLVQVLPLLSALQTLEIEVTIPWWKPCPHCAHCYKHRRADVESKVMTTVEQKIVGLLRGRGIETTVVVVEGGMKLSKSCWVS
jgi:hypothetical protein